MAVPDLYIVIDPGGEFGVRDGVNVTTYPSSYKEARQNPIARRTDFGRILTGSQSATYELKWEAMVSEDEYRKLCALHALVTRKIEEGGIPEILIYNFFAPFQEFPPQTRAHVPGTTPVTVNPTISYSTVMAGIFQLETLQWSQLPVVGITFTESFVVRKEDLYP